MRKTFAFLVLLLACVVANAQDAFTQRTVVKSSVATKELFNRVKSALMPSMTVSKERTYSEDSLVFSGKGIVEFKTNTVYSSIVGSIEYEISAIVTPNRVELIMTNCTHKPANKAAFDNNMGVLVDPLPKDLSTIGVTGANRKACYKYFYKNGIPLCEKTFQELCDKLNYGIAD